MLTRWKEALKPSRQPQHPLKNTMKTPNTINHVREHLKHLALAVAVAVGLGPDNVQAATLTWAVAGDGAWDTSAANWTGDSTTFTNNDDVIFDNATGGTITVAPGMLPNSTSVNCTGGYMFTGAPIGGGSLTKDGYGLLEFMTTPSSFSSTTVNGGTLLLQGEGGFGQGPVTMTDVTVNAGGRLQSFQANVTGNLTMDGGTYFESSGWSSSWSGSIYLAADSNFSAGYSSLYINAPISGPGGLTWGCNGYYGGLYLTASNSYTGPTIVTQNHLICQNSNALGNGGALSISDGAWAQLDYTGTHVVSALTINGVLKPAGVYGSSSSTAPVWNQDDAHFIGTGTVTAQGTPPVLATFTAVPNSGAAPLEVVFTDTSSSGYGPDHQLVLGLRQRYHQHDTGTTHRQLRSVGHLSGHVECDRRDCAQRHQLSHQHCGDATDESCRQQRRRVSNGHRQC